MERAEYFMKRDFHKLQPEKITDSVRKKDKPEHHELDVC